MIPRVNIFHMSSLMVARTWYVYMTFPCKTLMIHSESLLNAVVDEPKDLQSCFLYMFSMEFVLGDFEYHRSV